MNDNKPLVWITGRLPEVVLDRLTNFRVRMNRQKRHLTRQEIIRAVRQADALICFLYDKIDAQVLKEARNLKIVANVAVGFDNIDVAAARERNIYVSNTPGVLTDATADLTWALILATVRRIVEADRFTRARKFKGWEFDMLLGMELKGKTLGIVGLGRIGQAVAERAQGFGLNLVYYDMVRPDPAVEERLKVRYVPLEELLATSDIVTLHVPLMSQTYHLMDGKRLAMMKHSAYLVNTSRGPVIEEKALIKALKSRRLAGAGLDVYEHEPKISPELMRLPNVVLLPHIGSATVEARTRMAMTAVENVIAALSGQVPPNMVT